MPASSARSRRSTAAPARTTRHGSWKSASGSTASSATPAAPPAPYGVNLIVHKSNPRLQADLEISIKHKVPLIITSLGAVKELVGAVQGYGGLVFHDVINMRHARKAAEAGVDGLIAVCAGAGGHAGPAQPVRAHSGNPPVLSEDDPALRRDVDRPPYRGRAHARRRPRLSRHALHRDAREHGGSPRSRT